MSDNFEVSFTDISAPARNDGNPWTTVVIAEASELDGPWTTIDTIVLDPVDADPSQPQSRDFSTSNGTVLEGFYTLTFFDAAGARSRAIEQIQDVPSEIQPSLSDLGSFMRARTVQAGSGGNELGTFTDQTRPTGAEALGLIHQATNYVLMDVGAEIPDRAIMMARFLVVAYAAQLVELTFFRNEVARGQSAYEQYQALYANGIKALKASVADEGPAAPQAGFWSVPVLSARQAHWQNIFAAMDPTTGVVDPSKLPPEEYFPAGAGGIPPSIWNSWPLLFGDAFGAGMGLAWLED